MRMRDGDIATVNIDIDDYLDEAGTDELVWELKRRAKRENKSLRKMFSDAQLPVGDTKEIICDLLGLNYLASKDDIIIELIKKLK